MNEVEILNELPEGCKVISGWTTAPIGYVWVCNVKSRFDGEYKHALKEQNDYNKCPN